MERRVGELEAAVGEDKRRFLEENSVHIFPLR